MFRVGQLWTELRRVRQSWVKTAGDRLRSWTRMIGQAATRLGRYLGDPVGSATIPVTSIALSDQQI